MTTQPNYDADIDALLSKHFGGLYWQETLKSQNFIDFREDVLRIIAAAEETAFLVGCIAHGMPDEDAITYIKAFKDWKAQQPQSGRDK